jgi:hypothetical protein
MDQSSSLYNESPAFALVGPWLQKHLPRMDSAAASRLIQLAAGIFEKRSVLLDTIAESTVFTAEPLSNVTQVRRIIRDERITLESVYYPLIAHLLSEMTTDVLYLTMDESSHGTDYQLFQVGLATDGISLPLGFLIYGSNDAWAEDARDLLRTLARYLPAHMQIVLLADRIHTGEPFLACLEELGWDFVFRAPSDTFVELPKHGWKTLKTVYKQRNNGRFFNNVRVWKGNQRRANISIYKYARKGFRTTTWYIISSLPACKERFAEYACRWWQECTFKDLKSALFQWERGRVIAPERVEVLLIGVSCAIWAMWLLGRMHEHIPRRKVGNTRPQQRRKSIIKQGITIFVQATKRKQLLVLPKVFAPRVLEYERHFAIPS